MLAVDYDLREQFAANDEDRDWILEQVANLTESHEVINVVQWAEKKRYLPPELTSQPGYYDALVAPHMIEIMEALSANSPITILDLMKSAQIAATTAAENVIGYQIDHAPGPAMYLTADDGLAQRWMETRLDAMLEHSELDIKIQSSNTRGRKSGNTATKKEYPGGFLIAQGARSAAKMRMTSIKYLTQDEIDGWPAELGDEGDTTAIAENRTRGFEDTRKIFTASTPLVLSSSRIYKRYKLGDQRKYHVCCPHCGELQELKWHWKTEDGENRGIIYEVDEDGDLVEDTVGYRGDCCDGVWRNHDKAKFLQPANGARWIPTAKSSAPTRRSYHISALYSPVGIYSWVALVRDWLKAWDPLAKRVRDIAALQVFQNQSLGLPWEDRGEAPKAERVMENRRAVYQSGEIPNTVALKEAGTVVQLLTMAADIHKDRIDLELVGWCPGGRSYSISWESLRGDTANTDNEVWEQMRERIERRVWRADDGKQYRPVLTFIDSKYRTDAVMTFCAEYASAVVAIQGKDRPRQGAKHREFWEFTGQNGMHGIGLNVTTYKDRLAAWLRKEWEGVGEQPLGFCNYPSDYPDSYFRQYSAETRKEDKDKRTGFTKFYWKKTRDDNHAWDCRVYNMAALDYVVYNYCLHNWGLDEINYNYFWDWLREIPEHPFYF